MRRTATFLAATLLLAGCMPSLNTRDPYDDYGDRQLTARLHDTGYGLEVGLSEEAYAAVFEVLPNQGVRLVAPEFSSDSEYFRAGWTHLRRTHSPWAESWYRSASYRGSYHGPRYFLLVASRQPLHIDRFQNAPRGFRRRIGEFSFATRNADMAMDEVVRAVVPYQPDTDWATDALVIWPRDYDRGYDPYWDSTRNVRIICQDGSEYIVPLSQARGICPRVREGQRPPPPPPPDTTAAPEPDDSTGFRRPDPRRPVPGDPQTHPARPRPEIVTPRVRRPEPREAFTDPATGRREGDAETDDRPRVLPPVETGDDGDARPLPGDSTPATGAPSEPRDRTGIGRVRPADPATPEPVGRARPDGGRTEPRRETPRPGEGRPEPRRPESEPVPPPAPPRQEPQPPAAEPRREEPQRIQREDPRPVFREEPRRETPVQREEPRPVQRAEPAERAEPVQRAEPPPEPSRPEPRVESRPEPARVEPRPEPVSRPEPPRVERTEPARESRPEPASRPEPRTEPPPQENPPPA